VKDNFIDEMLAKREFTPAILFLFYGIMHYHSVASE